MQGWVLRLFGLFGRSFELKPSFLIVPPTISQASFPVSAFRPLGTQFRGPLKNIGVVNNIKLSLHKLIPTALLALLRTVIANITGNANFLTPRISVADMILQADALEAAITAATNGDRQSRILRDNLVLETKDMLRNQADYVRSICNGDRAMLESSGFELARGREPVGKVGVPQNVKAHTGLGAGELEFSWRGVHAAHGYFMELALPNAQGALVWTALPFTTRTRNILTGLDSHQLYSLRVTAVGVNGSGLVSAVVQAVAA